jgi:hypothetical protein
VELGEVVFEEFQIVVELITLQSSQQEFQRL